MTAHRLFIALAFGAGLATAPPLTAQKPSAHVRGVVKDTESRPLDGATIEVLGQKLRAQSATDGGFRIDSIPPGRYWLSVRRIGYVPVQITMTLDADSTRELPIEMERMPTRLSEIAVTGDAMTKYKYQDFYWRSKSAFGKFLTRDDLSRTHAFDLIDVVQRYLPGRSRYMLEQRFWFDPSPRGSWSGFQNPNFISAASSRGSLNPDCPPAVSINGGSPWPGASLVDFSIDDVEAVEVYRHDRWVPISFGATNFSNGCGLVVLWLK